MLKKACSVLVLLIFCFTYINVFEFEIISKNTYCYCSFGNVLFPCNFFLRNALKKH